MFLYDYFFRGPRPNAEDTPVVKKSVKLRSEVKNGATLGGLNPMLGP